MYVMQDFENITQQVQCNEDQISHPVCLQLIPLAVRAILIYDSQGTIKAT